MREISSLEEKLSPRFSIRDSLMMMEMLILPQEPQEPRRLLLKSLESLTVRTLPSKTLRTLSLTRPSQSLLLLFNLIPKNLMLMDSSS
jgi:hypothetical protein